MKIFTYTALFIVLLHLLGPAHAQNLIAVQNGNAPSFYTKIDSAIIHAQNGDTIYLPGGSFEAIIISKRLHIFGVGIHPDSTVSKIRTVIKGVTLKQGANNGSITGCYISVYCYSGCPPCISIEESIDQYSITRCYINSGISVKASSYNLIIAENIIGSFGQGCLYGGDHSIDLIGSKNIIANNIILASISSQGGDQFKNNIFLYSTTWCGPLSCSNDEFLNNIFLGHSTTSNCISKNNLGCFSNGIDGYSNQGINNYSLGSNSFDEVFVSYSVAGGWSFGNDLHLAQNSPYHNAGTDGTDIGIYGGIYPWKEGSIPTNPHFQKINISPKTDNSGNLNVKIKVAAQDN